MTAPGCLVAPFIAKSAKELTYVGGTSSTSDLTTYTFAGHSLGTPVADRRVIVSVCADGVSAGTTVDTVTIGGVTATVVDTNFNGNAVAAIAIALVPTGATGDIVVTHSAGKANCRVDVWTATGLLSNTPVDFDAGTGTNPTTYSMTSVADGILVANRVSEGVASTTTWTVATENADTTLEGTTTVSAASMRTTGTSTAPTAEFASGAGNETGACATW